LQTTRRRDRLTQHATAQEVVRMPTTDPRALIRTYIEEVFNRGNVAAVDALFAPDYQGYLGRRPMDRSAIKQSVSQMRAAMPDFHATVDAVLADGDLVTTRWAWHGTPAGAPEQITTRITIFRIVDGKVQESWAEGPPWEPANP
jgi:predicted SnoaL-like aldol condensation-catalyzing enzyme